MSERVKAAVVEAMYSRSRSRPVPEARASESPRMNCAMRSSVRAETCWFSSGVRCAIRPPAPTCRMRPFTRQRLASAGATVSSFHMKGGICEETGALPEQVDLLATAAHSPGYPVVEA